MQVAKPEEFLHELDVWKMRRTLPHESGHVDQWGVCMALYWFRLGMGKLCGTMFFCECGRGRDGYDCGMRVAGL